MVSRPKPAPASCVNVADDLKINISLQVGAVTDAIEVKEEVTPVETGTAAAATTIDGTQVRELALNTRNYEALVALMPGVAIKANPSDELYIGNSSPSGASAQIPYSVNGNRNSANNWMVDGADNVDRGANLTLMTFPSVDSIAEFKVERSLYSADTGRAGGGQINVVTKSGTSQFHGSLYEFFRNDKLAANNWSNNANSVNLVNGKAAVPPLRWNDFGGTIGGPVPLRPLQQGQEQDVLLLLRGSPPHPHLHHAESRLAHHRDAAGHIHAAGLHHDCFRRLPHRLRTGHADPDQPDQPEFGGLHQGHLQQAAAPGRQHHRRLLPGAEHLQQPPGSGPHRSELR